MQQKQEEDKTPKTAQNASYKTKSRKKIRWYHIVGILILCHIILQILLNIFISTVNLYELEPYRENEEYRKSYTIYDEFTHEYRQVTSDEWDEYMQKRHDEYYKYFDEYTDLDYNDAREYEDYIAFREAKMQQEK